MFSVYEELESVQMVKGFGRLKTMAYVKYNTPAAASAVLSSFHEDQEHNEDIMKVGTVAVTLQRGGLLTSPLLVPVVILCRRRQDGVLCVFSFACVLRWSNNVE